MHPFQGRVSRAHYALSEVVPAVYEMLRRDVVKVAGAGVPIRRVGDVLCGGGKDSRQTEFTKLLSRAGRPVRKGHCLRFTYQAVQLVKYRHARMLFVLWVTKARHVGELGVILDHDESFAFCTGNPR